MTIKHSKQMNIWEKVEQLEMSILHVCPPSLHSSENIPILRALFTLLMLFSVRNVQIRSHYKSINLILLTLSKHTLSSLNSLPLTFLLGPLSLNPQLSLKLLQSTFNLLHSLINLLHPWSQLLSLLLLNMLHGFPDISLHENSPDSLKAFSLKIQFSELLQNQLSLLALVLDLHEITKQLLIPLPC